MLAATAFAQITPEQKTADFLNLAGIYAKGYAPYEWKRDVFHFDLFQIQPWLDQVAAAKDDLDFYDVCVRYVASLKSGGHDRFLIPSDFIARLNFTVDIYDGKTLIDSITRSLLPADRFPFQIGDELVSVDGKTSEQLLIELAPYGVVSSPGAQRRSAAGTITTRSQRSIARAIDLGDSATVVIRRDSGDIETYAIPWTKSGIPLTRVGPVPAPRLAAIEPSDPDLPGSSPDPEEPQYMAALRSLQNVQAYGADTVLGSGAIRPIFTLPPDWTQRLGTASGDEFFSGTSPWRATRSASSVSPASVPATSRGPSASSKPRSPISRRTPTAWWSTTCAIPEAPSAT
jgi:hypothetical protein